MVVVHLDENLNPINSLSYFALEDAATLLGHVF